MFYCALSDTGQQAAHDFQDSMHCKLMLCLVIITALFLSPSAVISSQSVCLVGGTSLWIWYFHRVYKIIQKLSAGEDLSSSFSKFRPHHFGIMIKLGFLCVCWVHFSSNILLQYFQSVYFWTALNISESSEGFLAEWKIKEIIYFSFMLYCYLILRHLRIP